MKWLKIALAVYLLASLFSGFSSWLQIELLQSVQNGQTITTEAAEANDLREQLSGVFLLVVYIGTAILFFRWTVLAKRNAAAFGARGLEYTPGMSVGYYFIPILTLWKPYQALKETFKASNTDHRADWKSAPHPALLPLWWTIWLISGSLSQAEFRISMRADTIPEILTASWLSAFEALVEIPLVAVVWVMVSTMRDWQAAKYTAVLNESDERVGEKIGDGGN